MAETTPRYHSYLVRFWRDNEDSPWRVQMEDPHTGERLGFSSVKAMNAFLEKQLQEGSKPIEAAE